MDRGDLVPDSVILGIIKRGAGASRAHAKGVLLDGVVRTVPQAEGLDASAAAELGRKVDAVLCFDIDDEEIVRRLSDAHGVRDLPDAVHRREPGSACDKCGGTLVRRKDDEPEAIRNRLARLRASRRRRCSTGTAQHGTQRRRDRRGRQRAGRHRTRARRAGG